MLLSCPACRAEMTLDVVISTEAARDAVQAALLIPPPLGKLLIQYLALFRTGKRQLTWERTASLIAELALPIAEGQFERNGRAWPATLDYWRFGLETVLQARDGNKLTLPLKSHGYLLEVITGFTTKAEAEREAKTEANRRSPYRKLDGQALSNQGASIGEALQEVARRQMPPEVRENLVRLGHLAKDKK